jgi:hypothetical protein
VALGETLCNAATGDRFRVVLLQPHMTFRFVTFPFVLAPRQ